MTVPQWAVTAAGSTKRPASIPSTTAMTMRKVRELSALPPWWGLLLPGGLAAPGQAVVVQLEHEPPQQGEAQQGAGLWPAL